MSYSIITETKKGIIDEIPISTHKLFHEYWLPLFEKHKLENLSNWKFPHEFEKEELERIIKELEKLLPYIKGDWELERANFILTRLKSIKFGDYESISFG
ncbi:MAG: hypothetical protein J6O88_11535 [Chryseobacterium sp.]|uniref:hypothetical protein n=1 Tax=Chryseobacterium sp. TaxID=1871047 RepID=UPI001B028BCC|nr:hypothetical protein [Chryseobacterium sp.]MBO6185298.1 hypothetical protein [Chryseobacterium sp.]